MHFVLGLLIAVAGGALIGLLGTALNIHVVFTMIGSFLWGVFAMMAVNPYENH